MSEANEVIKFWLNAGPKSWFTKDDGFDQQIHQRFAALHQQASNSELNSWQDTPNGALALVLILDQFSRNLFRDDARAFAQDAHALKIARSAIERGYDAKVDKSAFVFFYMPMMHSESILDQRLCVRLFHAVHMPDNLKYAIIHRDIIDRFGHFPHRNKVLSRPTSPREQDFLDQGGFSG